MISGALLKKLLVAGDNGLVEYLFAEPAFQADAAVLVQHLEIAYRSGIGMGDAVGIRAGKNVLYPFGKAELPFLHNLELLNNIHSGIGSEYRQLIGLILGKRGVFDLDEILVSEGLGGQVEADGYGLVGIQKVKQLENFQSLSGRNMVDDGSVSDGLHLPDIADFGGCAVSVDIINRIL